MLEIHLKLNRNEGVFIQSQQEFEFYSAEELTTWAEIWGRHAPSSGLITLEGVLGAGKTTWVQGFLRARGVTDRVRSPTFTWVEEYILPTGRVCHFDFYRLSRPQDVQTLGLDDYFDAHTLCLVEWPSHAAGWLPEPDLNCTMTYSSNGRRVATQARGQWCRIEEGVLNEFKQLQK